MKKIVLLSLVLLPLFAIAQFSKGQIYLGGTMSASVLNNNYPLNPGSGGPSKSNVFSISPVFGYFLNPKLAIGGSIGYSSSDSESDFLSTFYVNNNIPYTLPGYVKTITNSISVSSFTRYYIALSHSFYFAAQGQISFSRSNNRYENVNNGSLGDQTTDSPSYSLGASLKPVFIFFSISEVGD